MISMIFWMLGIGVSVAALVVLAALKQFYAHMTVAAGISIVVALASIAETRMARADQPSNEAGVAVALRHMGLVWTWAALGLLVTYAFDILQWREWWQFFIAMFVLAGLSLFLSATVRKDAESGSTDQTMLKIARGFSIFVMVAMLITMFGLLVDGKMWRFTTVAGLRRGSQDWAANNIFFFGAMALAAISANAIIMTGRAKAAA